MFTPLMRTGAAGTRRLMAARRRLPPPRRCAICAAVQPPLAWVFVLLVWLYSSTRVATPALLAGTNHLAIRSACHRVGGQYAVMTGEAAMCVPFGAPLAVAAV